MSPLKPETKKMASTASALRLIGSPISVLPGNGIHEAEVAAVASVDERREVARSRSHRKEAGIAVDVVQRAQRPVDLDLPGPIELAQLRHRLALRKRFGTHLLVGE